MDSKVRNQILTVVFWAGLGVVALLPWEGRAAEEKSPDFDSDYAKNLLTVGDFLEQRGADPMIEPLLGLLKIDRDEPLDKSMMEMMFMPGRPPMYTAAFDNSSLMSFTPENILSRYSWRIHEKGKSEGAADLSKSDAIELMEKLLTVDIFGPRDLEGLKCEIDPEGVQQRRGPMQDKSSSGSWHLNARRIYKGVECLSGIMMSVDIQSGRIVSIVNFPFYPPDSMEEVITKEEALAIAVELTKGKGIEPGDINIRKMLTHPYNPNRQGGNFSSKSVLCWVASFGMPIGEHHKHPTSLDIDIRTGELLGTIQ